MPADVTGYSDPYVCVTILPEIENSPVRLTKFKKKTLNPKYNETFTFTMYALLWPRRAARRGQPLTRRPLACTVAAVLRSARRRRCG